MGREAVWLRTSVKPQILAGGSLRGPVAVVRTQH